MSDRTITRAQREAALAEARSMIATLREQFDNGLASYSDAQVWQALIAIREDKGMSRRDAVAFYLLTHALERTRPPEAEHFLRAPGDATTGKET